MHTLAYFYYENFYGDKVKQCIVSHKGDTKTENACKKCMSIKNYLTDNEWFRMKGQVSAKKSLTTSKVVK